MTLDDTPLESGRFTIFLPIPWVKNILVLLLELETKLPKYAHFLGNYI